MAVAHVWVMRKVQRAWATENVEFRVLAAVQRR